MKLKITQEVKEEIDLNLQLQAQLLDIIKTTKISKKITELDENCLALIRLKLELSEYSFDDLNYCIPKLVSMGILANNEGKLLIKTIISINNESQDCFFNDSEELKSLIKEVYTKIKPMTKEKRNSYLETIENELDNDKYLSYIYQRALFDIDIIIVE